MAKRKAFFIGVDVGGTFTDAVVMDSATNELHISKAPTTPVDLVEGVLGALEGCVGIPLSELVGRAAKFAHGTTQSSNALFTRSGVRVGLIATRGFGDQILIMRGTGRVAGLSLAERRHFAPTDKPDPLVPRPLIAELTERVDFKGNVLTPLDVEGARKAARGLLDRGCEAIAVALLWSFRNSSHEAKVREIIRELSPSTYISLSSEIAPVMGEYERTATAVIDAHVGPPTLNYIERLKRRLADLGLSCPLLLLQASGGVVPADQLIPIHTIESGPAAGIIGSKFVADVLKLRNVIATDVGGTTFKAGLLVDGQWSYARETVLAQYHCRMPMVDIVSIGAGGGSIAWVDERRLRVGPRSAGAEPGPACYGRGGEEPTVTDADVVLGYIDPDYFLGGRMKIRRELAVKAIKERIADPLFGGDVLLAAYGIKKVVDSQMADLIRKVTIERGQDPRNFTLMVYGGAGPTHCGGYGRDAGLARAVIPFTAPVHSAFGAVASDLRHSFEWSEPISFPPRPERIGDIFRRLEARARELLRLEGKRGKEIILRRFIDMRYRRQMHEVTMPFSGGRVTASSIRRAISDFEGRYEALYGKGSAYREAGIELTAFKLHAIGVDPKPSLPRRRRAGGDARAALKEKRPVFDEGRGAMVPTRIYDGERLEPGHRISGPAVVDLPNTTVVLHSRQRAEVDEYLNIVLELGSS